MVRKFSLLVAYTCVGLSAAAAQGLDAARDDQIARLQNYVLDAIQPSGLVRDSLVLSGPSFHPATPDAAGFALIALSAFDHLDTLPNAEQHVINVLSAYAGETPGVTPVRSTDGHFLHFIDEVDGSDPPGWDDSFTPIGSALLVAGAQFATNHFPDNPTIASLTEQLTTSIDFDAAIHPSLDGRIYLDMTAQGGGAGGAVSPWNEFMLVTSLALRQPNNDRALAVKDLWLDVDSLPKRLNTLTDNPSTYAPAFWVQQMHFFNGDFRHNAEFEAFFENHQQLDQQYSTNVLGESFRYGLTAGVSPQGYSADSISNHPNNVFSPEAVAAWGDMDTFLDFYNSQYPTTDQRYRYGLLRESATQPDWVPNDIGLVDHLFLLFGLVESIDADFFADRVIPEFIFGDFEHDGDVDGRDFLEWQSGLTSEYDASELTDWHSNFGTFAGLAVSAIASVPEASTCVLLLGGISILASGRVRLDRSVRR
ncbi:MAG: hypothetical protein AAGD11_13685 [Planctomycetota bacterium]